MAVDDEVVRSKETAVSGASQTKTIHEFLAENPNVDVSQAHAALWEIITELKDRTS